ncbi:MAG: hypothetical protein AAFP02_13675 [Bacteroidota bacterium]
MSGRDGSRPHLGNSLQMLAMDNQFWGTFPSGNQPIRGDFPYGVHFQRIADFEAQTLRDFEGNPVEFSIDPYFFRVSEIP